MVKNKPKDFKPRTYKVKNGYWTVFDGLCKGCGLCLSVCPFGGIEFSSKDSGIYSTPGVKVNVEKCEICGNCQQICPESAIAVESKK
jgi:2-oxoglutarate ferredoxin oxidoreductase subunit delta